MPSDRRITRRVFIARTTGLTLTLGAGGLLRPQNAFGATNPYSGGVWLAGDHHIHTKYSPDGQYEIEQQVANAERYGLSWCVITDHGGPRHDKVAIDQAYPDLKTARGNHPNLCVFQGLEWNIPSAEHGSIILPPTADEADRISTFEAMFDEKNISRNNPAVSAESDAVAGVKYLQSLTPKPLFFANHPARRGFDSPHEMRAWADAGPDVTRGFEGAPGHQACTKVGHLRGEYEKSPVKGSWSGFPDEAYRTWGGYDWYVAKIGGLWDSLLGEGRPWYITADSDSHRHWDDRSEVDESTYLSKGHVTITGHQLDKTENGDFYPGEYTKTWVYANRHDPIAIMDALRSGSMFTVLGDLIDRLELSARTNAKTALMGSTLLLDRAGEDVTITLRLHVPSKPNFGGGRPALHHVDLIAGDIIGLASDRDAMTNPTTKLVAQLSAKEGKREGDYITFTHKFPHVKNSFYLRVRGTNTAVDAPKVDAPTVSPWDDLWFYSNPVMVRVPGA